MRKLKITFSLEGMIIDKNIFALSLFGALSLTTSALAETNVEQTNNCCNTSCCETCCCKPKPKKCIDCECYTPQFYDLQCDCGFFVDGEFLYWFARENNLSYATKIKSESIPPLLEQDLEFLFFAPQTCEPRPEGRGMIWKGLRTPPKCSFELPGPKGPGFPFLDEYLSTRWNPGFRVGIGYNSECDGWDYFLSWTYFHNKKRDSISVSPDYQLNVLVKTGELVDDFTEFFLADNQEFLLLNPWINASFHGMPLNFFGTSLSLASEQGLIVSFDKIVAKWQIYFNNIDLEIGRRYWLSRCLQLRPYTGLRGTRTNTTFRTESFRNTSFAEDAILDINFIDHFKTHRWSAGILGGIQPTWYFCNNIALLWGEHKNRKQEKYQSLLSEEDLTLALIPRTHNLSKSKFFEMTAILDLAIGLRWEETWCSERFRTNADIGWEHHIWFDHNHRIKTSDLLNGMLNLTSDGAVRLPNKFANGFRSYNEVTSNLSYGGLVARLRLDFE